jgi:methylenetetrahydrofolate dehydrogenase (NADP+) / methenyltetrahydrofolate cyclohydrolase
MTAVIIDGKKISEIVRAEWKERADKLKAKGVLPGLAVIIVGDNPASKLYVSNKIKACHEVGLHSEVHDLPEDTSEKMLLTLIEKLNQAKQLNGILVQLPLPKHIDDSKVLETIKQDKDVDGFHLYNVGALMTGNTVFPPCTPFGVMRMLSYCDIPIAGQNAVIVGRSNIVGKPMAMLLLQEDATVTICTSKTKDLVGHTKRADILVVATGRPEMIKAEHVKKGAVVIDVGINRRDNGKLVGDVDFDEVKEVASHITPVPGGVGPMTITMLVANTIMAAERDSGNLPTN